MADGLRKVRIRAGEEPKLARDRSLKSDFARPYAARGAPAKYRLAAPVEPTQAKGRLRTQRLVRLDREFPIQGFLLPATDFVQWRTLHHNRCIIRVCAPFMMCLSLIKLAETLVAP